MIYVSINLHSILDHEPQITGDQFSFPNNYLYSAPLGWIKTTILRKKIMAVLLVLCMAVYKRAIVALQASLSSWHFFDMFHQVRKQCTKWGRTTYTCSLDLHLSKKHTQSRAISKFWSKSHYWNDNHCSVMTNAYLNHYIDWYL